MSGKRLGGLVVVAFSGAFIIAASIVIVKSKETINNIASPKTFALTAPATSRGAMELPTPVVAFAVTPTEPTTNPTDPYDPIPLRIGTVGAAIFHHPFCPYAKQSLANHGLEKRINYWTREQVAASGRGADHFCLASIFDCSDVSPTDFANSGNDPWCGANVSRRVYDVSGIDALIAGKTLCNLQGYIGTFVDSPADCIDGTIRSSSPACDQEACEACTADCETICEGCVRVTLSPLNKVTLGLGDANKDGQLDIDDYLYYHECYRGPSISATSPCVNVFDWDEDGDVDVDDFANFAFSYDSGNESWAYTNYPPASYPNTRINPERQPLPLRVGTEGASYYHRLDCPSVNASWATHGIDKRVDFFSWKQVEDSGRVSDNRTCFAGTRDNPSGSLQDCTLDDDGDGTFNCDDGCPENDNKIEPGECGCEVLKMDPGQCGCLIGDLDSDGDGVANCIDECPTDPDKTEPGLCGCGIPDTDSDNDGTPNCNDPVTTLYENSFDVAGDLAGWFDTGENNSLIEDPLLFSVADQGTFIAFSTSSDLVNIHSHHIGSATWTGYKYVGKMMVTESEGFHPNIGVTFFSDYPNSDVYYRLRSAGSTFHINPHGTEISSGNIDTGVTPVADTWYHFSILVRNTDENGTEIHAKVWIDGSPEPEWQVDCFDNNPTKRTQGSFGVWSMGLGSRYWDDITVTNY